MYGHRQDRPSVRVLQSRQGNSPRGHANASKSHVIKAAKSLSFKHQDHLEKYYNLSPPASLVLPALSHTEKILEDAFKELRAKLVNHELYIGQSNASTNWEFITASLRRLKDGYKASVDAMKMLYTEHEKHSGAHTVHWMVVQFVEETGLKLKDSEKMAVELLEEFERVEGRVQGVIEAIQLLVDEAALEV